MYSTTAWLCLRFPENVIYIQCVREVYEAYVIYCFLQYLVYYLGEEHDEMASAKLAKVSTMRGREQPPTRPEPDRARVPHHRPLPSDSNRDRSTRPSWGITSPRSAACRRG